MEVTYYSERQNEQTFGWVLARMTRRWKNAGEGNYYTFADYGIAHYANRIGDTFCETELSEDAVDATDEWQCPICAEVNRRLGNPI
jgi:hypothetical protein